VRHSRESGNPEAFEFLGFRVALAIASLPGMTIELCKELQIHHTSDSPVQTLAEKVDAVSTICYNIC
jgi:hypothetical protein